MSELIKKKMEASRTDPVMKMEGRGALDRNVTKGRKMEGQRRKEKQYEARGKVNRLTVR